MGLADGKGGQKGEVLPSLHRQTGAWRTPRPRDKEKSQARVRSHFIEFQDAYRMASLPGTQLLPRFPIEQQLIPFSEIVVNHTAHACATAACKRAAT